MHCMRLLACLALEAHAKSLASCARMSCHQGPTRSPPNDELQTFFSLRTSRCVSLWRLGASTWIFHASHEHRLMWEMQFPFLRA